MTSYEELFSSGNLIKFFFVDKKMMMKTLFTFWNGTRAFHTPTNIFGLYAFGNPL